MTKAQRRHLLILLLIIAAIVAGSAAVVVYSLPSAFLPAPLVLAFPNPTHAHVGVPLDFRYSYYNADNKPLSWSLTGAPAWVTVGEGGWVTGTPTSQASSANVTVEVADVTRSFPLTVHDSDHGDTVVRFVSPVGNDSNVGSKSKPWRTIEHALRQSLSGDTRLLYVRGGTYTETLRWEEGDTNDPFDGTSFTANDPFEIRGYPGEAAVLDCDYEGHGLWVKGSKYVVVSNLEVRNANRNERAGLMIGSAATDGDSTEHVVAKDLVVHSSDWSDSNNVAGVFASCSDCWINRTVAYDNKCTGDHGTCMTPHNSSNFLAYTDGRAGDMYWIDVKSYGSIVGFKVKHAGVKRLMLHNAESFADDFGVGMASNYASVRFAVMYQNRYAGIDLGVTDPNNYTVGPMLIEHVTVKNSGGKGVGIENGYLTSDAGLYQKNIVYNEHPAGTGEDDSRLLQLWTYTETGTALDYGREFDHNLYFSPSQNNVARIGKSSNKDFSFPRLQTEQDRESRFASPGFASSDNLSISLTSPAANIDGSDFAGAFKPGVTYDAVGEPSIVLVDFESGGGASNPTATPTPEPSPTPTRPPVVIPTPAPSATSRPSATLTPGRTRVIHFEGDARVSE